MVLYRGTHSVDFPDCDRDTEGGLNGYLNGEFMSCTYLRSKGVAFAGDGLRKNGRLHHVRVSPEDAGARVEEYSVFPGSSFSTLHVPPYTFSCW